MVNNNGIPIEVNKKPTETVYETKDYEIKKSPLSSAARSKVINKSGSNYLSEKERYGPCSYDNADCPHFLDFQEGYVSLYLSCPAVNCGGDGNQYHWKHAQPCGGRMYISTEANTDVWVVGKRVIEENDYLDVENTKVIRKSEEVQIEVNFRGH